MASTDQFDGPLRQRGVKRNAPENPHDEAEDRYSMRPAGSGTASQPTVKDIINDKLSDVANEYWAPGAQEGKGFDAYVIDQIYNQELNSFKTSRAVLLEFSCYLENYLWKYFDHETATAEHVLSIVIMVNEKFRENVPVWSCFETRPQQFAHFFSRVFALKQGRRFSIREKSAFITFLINCFQSLENKTVREACLRLVSFPLWKTLAEGRLRLHLRSYPELQSFWDKVQAAEDKHQKISEIRGTVEENFLPELVNEFFHTLGSVQDPGSLDRDTRWAHDYLTRFIELMIDLMAQLPTRRFFKLVLLDRHFLIKCRLSQLGQWSSAQSSREGKLFTQMCDILQFYLNFPIDDQTGKQESDHDVSLKHYLRLQVLQRLAFKHFKEELKPIYLNNVSAIDTRETLTQHLSELPTERLRQLCERLRILAPAGNAAESRDILIEILVSFHQRIPSKQEEINSIALYPTEKILWDKNLVPEEHYNGKGCLALPKLNMQFLTLHDYLTRNFDLFRLESTYEIREDITKAVKRILPRAQFNRQTGASETVFTGFTQFASKINEFNIVKIGVPNLGEIKPSIVKAECTVDLSSFRGVVREEWEELKQHDVVFLITVRARESVDPSGRTRLLGDDQWKLLTWEDDDQESLGIRSIRGGEIVAIADETKEIIGTRNLETGKVKEAIGNVRTYHIELDTAQYQTDMERISQEGGEDCYQTFNLLVRRRAKENNFKHVLSTIRNIMNQKTVLPDWFHDAFLGYGDPAACKYYNLPDQQHSLAMNDTFLDFEHVKECFPNRNIVSAAGVSKDQLKPPFRITFDASEPPPDYDRLEKGVVASKQRGLKIENLPKFSEKKLRAECRKLGLDAEAGSKQDLIQRLQAFLQRQTQNPQDGANLPPITVEPYLVKPRSPFDTAVAKKNRIRFTAVQTEAIKSALQHGLTQIVGPPGTGKTDVAVQAICNLYHNHPKQRTLIVTHSNQALNDIFQKIMERDIDTRYLLRLGGGHKELNTTQNFSKFGRVNHMLQSRIDLLEQVRRLAQSLGEGADSAETCETAQHFFLLHVESRWESFLSSVETERARLVADSAEDEQHEEALKTLVADTFPFHAYYADAPSPLFQKLSFDDDMRSACGAMANMKDLFEHVEECRAFEILRNYHQRGDFLMTTHSKIIAMTCTGAALKREDLLKLSFQYDNLVMEEAAQVLDIETFIPLVLQKPDREGGIRLKRVILLGDHHQLPPVVKNMAFQKFSHLDQSLFTRLVRLGSPTITLNMQGRMRPQLAELYAWRYKSLGNLKHTSTQDRFQKANAGFACEFQLIDVQDFQGQGESQPNPYFYQNLGEAEMIVQTFMFMRLLGYPAQKISILTTYNGQKHLLRDIIRRRCADHPLFGEPKDITTVDRFQGNQNDFVLLSLVRTKSVGHLRDVRRLVVALSRARLGLYVFCRQQLFENCYELTPSFNLLLQRPSKMHIVPAEHFPSQRIAAQPVQAVVVEDVVHMGQIVAQMTEIAETQYRQDYQVQMNQYQELMENERKKQEAQLRLEQAQRQAEAEATAKLAADAELARKKEKRVKKKARWRSNMADRLGVPLEKLDQVLAQMKADKASQQAKQDNDNTAADQVDLEEPSSSDESSSDDENDEVAALHRPTNVVPEQRKSVLMSMAQEAAKEDESDDEDETDSPAASLQQHHRSWTHTNADGSKEERLHRRQDQQDSEMAEASTTDSPASLQKHHRSWTHTNADGSKEERLHRRGGDDSQSSEPQPEQPEQSPEQSPEPEQQPESSPEQPQPEPESSSSSEDELTVAKVSKMRVVDLRAALKARGLDAKGLKAVLQKRLKDAVQ